MQLLVHKIPIQDEKAILMDEIGAKHGVQT